jgi:hypothetical protein
LVDDPDFFIRPKRFYESTRTAGKFFCASVTLATAQVFLLETPEHGSFVQAEYEMKLIVATRKEFREIVDAEELGRLKPLAEKLLAMSKSATASAPSEQHLSPMVRAEAGFLSRWGRVAAAVIRRVWRGS